MHAEICDYLLDVIHNSLEAGATAVSVRLEETDEQIAAEVADNGRGMSREELSAATDPFYTDGLKHRHRSVGLGLPFLFQAAEAAGGEAAVESTEGAGTACRFSFSSSHVDTPPLGDIAGTVLAACTYGGSFELNFRRTICRNSKSGSYAVSRSELEEAVGGFETAASQKLAAMFLRSLEEDLQEQ